MKKKKKRKKNEKKRRKRTLQPLSKEIVNYSLNLASDTKQIICITCPRLSVLSIKDLIIFLILINIIDISSVLDINFKKVFIICVQPIYVLVKSAIAYQYNYLLLLVLAGIALWSSKGLRKMRC